MLKKMVNEIVVIDDNEVLKDNKKECIHVGFGITKNFIRPVGVLITSILMNDFSNTYVFHIFIDDYLDDRDFKLLEELVAKSKSSIIIYRIDNKIFKGLNNQEFTIAPYYRFLIPYQLRQSASKYIYI